MIVIEWIDGTGKETQTNLLIKRIKEKGGKTAKTDFPQYGKKSAKMVEYYLNGKFGKAEEVSPYLSSFFYA